MIEPDQEEFSKVLDVELDASVQEHLPYKFLGVFPLLFGYLYAPSYLVSNDSGTREVPEKVLETLHEQINDYAKPHHVRRISNWHY